MITPQIKWINYARNERYDVLIKNFFKKKYYVVKRIKRISHPAFVVSKSVLLFGMNLNLMTANFLNFIIKQFNWLNLNVICIQSTRHIGSQK